MKKFKSNLERLSAGCLFRGYQKENTESEYVALGQTSKEARFLTRQWEYASEVERVLKELRLTKLLIRECSTGNVPHEVSRQELLVYYQGIFLNLVHQIKDKIMQLVHLMTEESIPKRLLWEDPIKVSSLLKNKQKKLQEIGIEKQIEEWDENSNCKIAYTLKKRTTHHHKVSSLKYNENFSRLNLTETLLKTGTEEIFTNEGKKKLEKMRKESEECLFSQASAKVEDTLKAIEGNIEKISSALVNHFHLPISEKEITNICNARSKMLDSFKITNASSFEKIPAHHKELLKKIIAKINEKYQKVIETIYLVGSLGRGEYEEGYSDVNIYIILSEEEVPEKTLKEIRNDIIYGDELNIRVFSKADFLSEKFLKYRIISKIDGLLLYGVDLVAKDKMPNAGLFTSLILNEDILDDLDEAKRWVKENSSASPSEISEKIRQLTKRIIDFTYGVVMSNKPQYTSSRTERIAKINETHPESKILTEGLAIIVKSGAGNLEDISSFADSFRPQAEKNLDIMRTRKKDDDEQRKRLGTAQS